MSILRSAVRYGYVPFMFIGLVGAAYAIVVSGHSYFWVAPIMLAAFTAAFAAEKIAPFFREWTDHAEHGDNPTNLAHILAYEWSSINGVLLIPVITWLFPFQGIWPTQWPLWSQLLLAFFIADFAFMMMHYLSHRIAPLWRLHAVHHGVGRLYGFNGVVRHPIHQTLDMIIGTAPLVVMGMTQDVAVLLGLMISVTLIVQHSNVDTVLGPLDGHISMGRLHHLHHVNWGTEGDCNFGLFLTVWDKMLGTFQREPSRPITARDMGLDEVPNFPKSFWEQLVFPFVYKPGGGEPERYRKPKSTPAQESRVQTERLHAAE